MDTIKNLYHGTDIQFAKKIIDTHQFNVSCGDELKLGNGVYFYDKKQFAIDWYFIKTNRNKQVKYDQINENWGIVKTNIDLNKISILDLQDSDNIIKLKKIIDYYNISFKKNDDFKTRCINKSIMINYLFKNKLVNIDCITDVIPMNVSNPTCYYMGMQEFKKIYCIKNTNILTNYYEIEKINENEFNKSKMLFG